MEGLGGWGEERVGLGGKGVDWGENEAVGEDDVPVNKFGAEEVRKGRDVLPGTQRLVCGGEKKG